MKKIKLIFSTGFDSFVYKTNTHIFNTKFVGELQLLTILERELGLTGEYKTTKERQAEYLEYLSNKLSGKQTFISESFTNDNIGVANELLKWRDELKLMNWDFQKGISERLDLLAEIEAKNSISYGNSDRWIQVVNRLKDANKLSIESIEVNDNIDLLKPLYKEIFNLLDGKSVEIIYKEIDVNLEKENNISKIKKSILNKSKIELETNDNSFQVIKFKDNNIASDFLAMQLSSGIANSLIINSNNYGLDTSLLTYKIPLSGSDIENVNPQVLQLFKLVSSLLFSKVNPYNLLSLLSLSVLPFPKALANKLRKVLIEKAGVGNEEWNESIENYKKNIDKDKRNWKEKINAIELYLNRERKDEIEKKELQDIYRDIATWSAKTLAIVESNETKTQLANLNMFSKTFIQTIQNIKEDKFTQRSLDKIINKIYDPINITINTKEKGSYTVLKQANQLYNNVENIIWFDFYNQDLSARFGTFLLKSEIDKLLLQKDILFWEKEHQIAFQIENFQKAILKTNEHLILLVSDKYNGEKTKEHPLFTQLSSFIENIDEFIYDFSFENNDWINSFWKNVKLSKAKNVQLPQNSDYIKVKETSLLDKRDVESFSSVNQLIQYPIDWLMNYQARITEKGLGSIGELMMLKGNLSHQIVQSLLVQKDIETVNVNDEIDKLLEIYTPQIASPFYLDENIFEYKAFVNQLKKSVKVLLEIIKNNKLEFHSFEKKVEGKIDIVYFAGSIDLLFKKSGVPVIFDLKWTYSSRKYYSLLEEEKAIQLAMYAKLEQNSNAITAYFLLSHASLYTTGKSLIGDNITIVKLKDDENYVNDRTVKRMINSFNYRWKELENGDIELGEDMKLGELNYHNDTEEKDLIPMDRSSDKKHKKPNPYSSYGLFKGNVK